MFIESELTGRVGEAGKRLHTGRSRNDQVALDLRLYLRDAGREIRTGFVNLYQTLLGLAEQHLDTVMPGYTHLQRAQPITLAHHLMAYVEMLARDISRLDDDPWAAWMSCRSVPARWPEQPIRSTANRWLLISVFPRSPRTAWMAFQTAISQLNWPVAFQFS